MTIFSLLAEGLLCESPAETVIKLLSLAERPGTPAEGEAALFQATRLAAKYGLNIDDLRKQINANQYRRAAPSPPYTQPSSSNAFADAAPILQGFGFKLYRTDRTEQSWKSERHAGFFVTLGGNPNAGGGRLLWELRSLNSFGTVYDSGRTLDELKETLATFDWAKAEADIKAEKERRETPSFNGPMSAMQQQVDAVAQKYDYIIEPPSSPFQTYRQYKTKDHTYKLVAYSDFWNHYTSVGTGQWKEDKIRKNKTAADLEAFLKTKRTSKDDTKLHNNPTLDKMMKLCLSYGFSVSYDWPKSSAKHFVNRALNMHIYFDRGNFGAKGRITAEETIMWHIGPAYSNGTIKDVPRKYGTGFDTFKAEMDKIEKAEVGPEAVHKVLMAYGAKPRTSEGISRQSLRHDYIYFDLSPKYAYAYQKVTGEWIEIEKMPNMWDYDYTNTTGQNAQDLEARLVKRGFKKGAHQDTESVIAKFRTICVGFKYQLWSTTPEKDQYMHHGDKNSTVSINKKEGKFRVFFWEYGTEEYKVLGEGTDPQDLQDILKKHDVTMHMRPNAKCGEVMKVALLFGFVTDNAKSATEDVFILVSKEDHSILELDKDGGAWQHFFHKKIIGSGITADSLQKHLEEVYGDK